MTMKLTIELDTIDELSERERGILQAIAGAQYIAIDLNAAEDITKSLKSKKQPEDDNAAAFAEAFPEDVEEIDVAGGGGVLPDAESYQPAAIVEMTSVDTNQQQSLDNQPEDIDAAGMPWDARINPKSRGKIKTGKRAGMWKYIKQLDTKQPGLIEQVEAENKARLIKQVHTPETEEQLEFEVGDNGEAIAAQTFAASNLPTKKQTLDFATFMGDKITPRMLEKPDFANNVNAVLAANGIKALTELISKQHLIPKIDQELDLLWATV